jgi:hypothetical protein
MELIRWLGVVLAVLLQVAVLTCLLKGAYRAYPMLLVFMVASFLSTVASTSAVLGSPEWTRYAARVFWICDSLLYAIIFALQVHLISQGLSGPQARRRIAYLIAGGIVFTALAIWTSHHPRMNLWMTQMIRNFGFGAMILNLALWTMLLRNPDRCRLMITAAFGIMLAGEAIGHSLRQMANYLVTLGNFVLIGTYLLSLYLLWRALSRHYVAHPNEEPSAALHPAG